jgi:hypothetical protein
MNWQIKKKRTKEVCIKLEWTEKGDLIAILEDLRALISSGIETYHDQKKSVLIADKWHNVEFTQKYLDVIYESKEQDINGELKLVIKSKI